MTDLFDEDELIEEELPLRDVDLNLQAPIHTLDARRRLEKKLETTRLYLELNDIEDY